MSFINSIRLSLNIILILLILIRSPNEQSLYETLNPLNLFESYGKAEKNLDNMIQILIVFFFVIGFISTSKAF